MVVVMLEGTLGSTKDEDSSHTAIARIRIGWTLDPLASLSKSTAMNLCTGESVAAAAQFSLRVNAPSAPRKGSDLFRSSLKSDEHQPRHLKMATV